MKVVKAQLGDAILTLEVLRTSNEHQKGFMFRPAPDMTFGLMFEYRTREPRFFWMQNVPFDLELLAFDETGRVRQIERLRALDLRQVAVSFPCERCIEVAAGFCAENDVHIGTQLIIR